MKTNVPIDLNDFERNMLAVLIDGKQSARKVTRSEVCNIMTGATDSLLTRCERKATGEQETQHKPTGSNYDLLRIDPEDRECLNGKDASYIIGWNKVKRR